MSEFRINKVNNNVTAQNAKKAKEKETQAQEETVVKPDVKYQSANEVLDYMAKSAITTGIKNTKAIDTTKYIDKASEERIAKVMKTFEKTIFNTAEAAISEFGLSDEAAMDVAIVGFNRKFLS